MLNVVMLNVIMLIVIMVNAVMLNLVMLSVIMLNVVAPKKCSKGFKTKVVVPSMTSGAMTLKLFTAVINSES
jgi:hypothetical protein